MRALGTGFNKLAWIEDLLTNGEQKLGISSPKLGGYDWLCATGIGTD